MSQVESGCTCNIVCSREKAHDVSNTSKDAECEKSARGIVSIDITPNKIRERFSYWFAMLSIY